MNIREYIESGILESYCLGVLSDEEKSAVELVCLQYPEIREELELIELALERYSEAYAIAPKPEMHDKIAEALINLEKEKLMDADDLPLISKYSDHKQWLKFVEDRIPADPEVGRTGTFLRQSGDVMQMLLVSATDFEEEIHEDLHESFLILKGECECTFGDTVFRLKAGGFAEVPLYESHSVKILSPYVVAVLQRVAI